MSQKSDLEIAQSCRLLPIVEIAKKLGIDEDNLELYGKYIAKIKLEVLEKFKHNKDAKYIDVTAITPTPLGEGKTVNTIGLSLGLNKIGKSSIATIRQPSLGPVFGIKGGAAGGGYSQVLPMENFNLHLTGDVHAVGIAHNLLASFLDNSILKGNRLNIDPLTITWPRVVDVSDRFLRKIEIGLGGKQNGIPRETSFDITVASEVMAILALTDSLSDLRKRLGKIIVAMSYDRKPITAEDLKVAGAMCVLLKDAIKPNLMQTTENTPCFVHTGPFANIAHGNSSILADKIGIKLCEYLITESGFGADCGAEKFFNIKCRASGLKPDCIVIVCSIRALKMHSGRFKVVPGKALEPGLLKEDIKAVREGLPNLIKQIENMKLFGIPVVVCINKFNTDTMKEIEEVMKASTENGADEVAISEVWEKGGEGGIQLAEAVVRACEKQNNFKYLYPLDLPIKDKINIIATKIYGASRVIYSEKAEESIKLYTELGFDKLPICMAKTHLSLSHDPNLKGRPTGFDLPIEEVKLSNGAGFLYPLCGKISTMPGLPTHPAGERIDIDSEGRIKGLF